MMVVYIILES